MAAKPRGRSLPLNPYAETPIEEWLARLAGHGNVEDRYRAFAAVASLLPAAEAWPHLIGLLTDDDAELRAAAAHWVARLAERRRLEPTDERRSTVRSRVSPLLNDDDPDVRLAAATALAAWNLLTPEVGEAVLQLLRHPAAQPTSLVAAAQLVPRFPELANEAVPQLAALLSAEQAELRESAAQALLQLQTLSAPAAPALVAALEDEEPLVRECAARTLGLFPFCDDSMLQGLQQATGDEDPEVAAAARASIARLDEQR